jgi:hypothetical protein
MKYKTSYEIERAVANWFGIRTHVIVPNLAGALLPYECDLVVLSKAGYLYEIEIKTLRSDLIRDRKKRKWVYYDDLHIIRKLWFAIPEMLEDAIMYIPQKAGILVINESGHIQEIRKPIIDNMARKLTSKEQFTLARVGAMRIWALKKLCIDLGAYSWMNKI